MTSVTEKHRIAWTDANARRMARQGLIEPLASSVPDAVAAMCGAHAQVLSAAELSIGVRMEGVTRSDVQQALWDDRSLVKTFGPRGTVHLLPARDLGMWTGALATIPMRNTLPEDARLTPGQADAVIAAISDALAATELTIDELGNRVIAATGPWAGDPVMPAFQELWPRWRQAIQAAAHRGVLCFGPNRGRKITYTHPRRIVPGFHVETGESARTALVRRYLHAYGPASPAHVARWLSAPKAWADEVFGSLDDELARVTLDGAEAWALAADAEPPAESPEGVRLLPYFDAFVVGSHPRDLLFPGRASQRALAGGQAGNFPVLLIDGIVAGVWHQRRSGRRIQVTVEPLTELTATQRDELGTEIERVGSILEARPQLTIGPVTVGPHA